MNNNIPNKQLSSSSSSLSSLGETSSSENIFYYVGENTHDRTKYIEDFTTMSQCDIIISSPSTYCISAGFIGKEKKIIHSKEWLDYRVEEDDKFWVDLYNGGNEDYKLWKMV